MEPTILTWDELQRRLTAVMEASPRTEYLKSQDPCIHRIIRLRDIARYCEIDRAEIYRVRRGERSLKPSVQYRLSWFFGAYESGKLVKEKQSDGKWRIVGRHPPPEISAYEADAGHKTIQATVDWATGRLKL